MDLRQLIFVCLLAGLPHPLLGDGTSCLPSAGRGAVDVVIAGHADHTCFRWVASLGLTAAHVYVYRRVHPDVPARTWNDSCG